MNAQATPRDNGLEALRGIAAVIVVLWHLMLGFAPGRAGIFTGLPMDHSWNGQPWFAVLYGPAAVDFFFLLSGFVLTRRALAEGDAASLARGAIKRWPRLAGPVLVVLLLSWLGFATGAYAYAPAAAMTHSPWLADFGWAQMAPPFRPTLPAAVWQGLYFVFLTGQTNFNSALWTMRVEFYGSFAAFGLGALLIALGGARPVLRAVPIVLAVLLVANADPMMLGFPLGVALAALLAGRQIRLGWPVWGACLLLGFYCAGFTDGRGAYAWMGLGPSMPEAAQWMHCLAALLGILAVEGAPPLRRLLAARWAGLLGRLSFPIYLLHMLVLCSLGCRVFLALQPAHAMLAKPAAAVATLAATFLLAWPLSWADRRWLRLLGRVTAQASSGA